MNILGMYDYRTACRHRAFDYGALVVMVTCREPGEWGIGWWLLGARHYSAIINAWMIKGYTRSALRVALLRYSWIKRHRFYREMHQRTQKKSLW